MAHTNPLPGYWRKLRARILAEQPLCEPCMALGRVRSATQVDHIKPRSQGGGHERGNLQSICQSCHEVKSTREALAGRGLTYRPKPSFGADGWPISDGEAPAPRRPLGMFGRGPGR